MPTKVINDIKTKEKSAAKKDGMLLNLNMLMFMSIYSHIQQTWHFTSLRVLMAIQCLRKNKVKF